MKLVLENIRTFIGRHEVTIKPLTILTGENSTGKTTFLASLSAVTARRGFPAEPRFNEPPYSLGSYDTIAAMKAKVRGQAKEFSLGWIGDNGPEDTIVATYRSSVGKAQLLECICAAAATKITVRLNEERQSYVAHVAINGVNVLEDISIDFAPLEFALYGIGGQILHRLNTDQRLWESFTSKLSGSLVEKTFDLFQFKNPTETTSIAPIRTRPERTYDQGVDSFNPEGRHIPFVLARVLGENSTARQRRSLVSALEQFGEESGLYGRIKIKNLGKKGTDPFQLLVDISGVPVNLLDVGYGVSQSLPVVVESVLATENNMLLIQQPEVHLHPRAQAALGSFFATLVANNNKQFVVETHSDYIVDRVRQEVANETISNEAVLILYFERHGFETTIYPLGLDGDGNIVDAPPTYRAFFLREEMSLLSRGSKMLR